MLATLCGCSTRGQYDGLQKTLAEYVSNKDADIGVAIIIDGKDTISVNGNRDYPMLSVYKFPIALALAEKYREEAMTFDSLVAVLPEDLHPDTYSPMTENILSSAQLPSDTLRLPAITLLEYMLRESDNNASDIVLREVGGANAVRSYQFLQNINVRNSEEEMHVDNSLCYSNSSTPIAMAELMDKFNRESVDSLSAQIKRIMETCETGANRLAKPLTSTNAILGHKTGTGFTLPDGRLMAVNDAGYVRLPNGRSYAIAVFIANSGYDMATTEAIIANISGIVLANID